MMSGIRPGALKASIEQTAKVLNQIRSEQDLNRLESELRKAYQPIREEMELAAKHGSENLMAFQMSLKENPETKGPMAAQSAAVSRLQSNQVLAKKVGEVMMGKSLLDQIESFRGQANSKALLAQSRLAVLNAQMAVTSFHNEYRSYPLHPNKTAQDEVTTTTRELTAILQGTHPSANGVAFLNSKEAQIVDAWGNPIRVIMDTNQDNVVNTPPEYGSKAIKKRVITDSSGPDGKFETIEDNLVSWKN